LHYFSLLTQRGEAILIQRVYTIDIDRPSTGDKEGDGAEGQDGADGDADAAGGEGADEEDDDDVQLPSFKKRNADGESPTPEQPKKKKKLAKKAKPTEGGAAGAVGPDGAELPLDPMQQKMSKLDRDFELAVKSGKSTSRRRKKDDEDIVSQKLFFGIYSSAKTWRVESHDVKIGRNGISG
jgi:hypothetical protein